MLTRHDLALRWSVHVNTIDHWRKLGLVPAPLILAKKTLRWREEDILSHEDWILRRADLRENGMDPEQAIEPGYSLPMANDPASLAREREASRHEVPPENPENKIEGIKRRIFELKTEATVLAGKLDKQLPADFFGDE